MSDAVEFVAEHIMGFERKHCQGTYGGGNIGMGGCETWFWCNWCGREVRDGTAGHCPHYPFPRFSMRDLMARLGSLGYHTMIRLDPQRDRHSFTVCLNEQRICDTDEPLESLCEYLRGDMRAVAASGVDARRLTEPKEAR